MLDRCPLCLIIAFLTLAGCATTSTKLAAVDDGMVEAEQQKQRELWLSTQEEQHQRLENIAYPILHHGVSLCPDDVVMMAGFRYANIYTYEGVWREAARYALGLGDTLEVLSVIDGSGADRAGLKPGDHILRLGTTEIPIGKQSMAAAGEWGAEFRASGLRHLAIEYKRSGERHVTTIAAEAACGYPTLVVQEGGLNAFADGKAIYVATAMMRFADDNELAVIVAHELAHNAMGHIDAKKKNAAAGALFGLLGDIAMAYSGVNTGGYYTTQFASLGAMTFSQNFEREADYVGMYALALAGLPLESAPVLWRHMAIANPQFIALAQSHPTSAERFVRMEQTVLEIEEKRSEGVSLYPNMRE